MGTNNLQRSVLVLAIVTSVGTLWSQVRVDAVFGNVEQISSDGVTMVYTFGTPAFDIIGDDDITVTVGIPPILLAGNTISNTDGFLSLTGVTVYPNPVVTHLSVESDPRAAQLEIRMFSMVGTEVLATEMLEGQSSIMLPLSDLPSGTYTLQVIDRSKKEAAHFSVVKP